MLKFLRLFLIIPLIAACEGESAHYSNPNIPNYSVNWQINLDLPQYNALKYPSNHAVNAAQGARGIVIYNTGSGYNAFDLACPNQPYNSCTTPMSVTGVEAKCSCDNTVYDLFTGQSSGQKYGMKAYRVEVNGNILNVYN